MEDLYEELRQLYALHEESEKTTRQSAQTTRQIAARIELTRAAIAQQEAKVAHMSALERRAWIRKINRGAVWAGTIAAAGTLREAAKASPGITTSVGALAVALGAGATALTIGIGGSQPPPIARPQPSISTPASQPIIPPIATPAESQPNSTQPGSPSRAVALPVQTAPAVEPALSVDGPPKASPPSPARPARPPEEPQAPTAVELSRTCVADLRLLDISVRLLCGQG